MTGHKADPSQMKLIGYWIQSVADSEYFPPQEFVGSLSDDTRRTIANYLESGELYETYRGFSWCRFGCDRDMGHREYSDGFWVWPEGLAHYVRDHGILLPEEFIDYVKTAQARIPKSRWSSPPLDVDFWKEWCRSHRSGHYHQRITNAKQEADEQTARWLARKVAELEAREGLSGIRCCWIGCTNRALAGRATCASCSLRDEMANIASVNYAKLREVLTEKNAADVGC